MIDLKDIELDEMPKRGPIPRGVYPVTVLAAEVKPTQKPGGRYIKLEYQVTHGKFEGARVWQNINFENANPVAAEIGKKQLKALLVKGNVPLTNSFDESQVHTLVGLKVGIDVNVKTDPEWGDKNEVWGYTTIEEAVGAHCPATKAGATQFAPNESIPF